jgi:hypothetical protein
MARPAYYDRVPHPMGSYPPNPAGPFVKFSTTKNPFAPVLSSSSIVMELYMIFFLSLKMDAGIS